MKSWGHFSFEPDTLVTFGESRFPSRQPSIFKVQDGLPESCEFGSLEGLGHVVTLHLVCGAVLCLDVALLHLIRDKEVMDIDVP